MVARARKETETYEEYREALKEEAKRPATLWRWIHMHKLPKRVGNRFVGERMLPYRRER